jgi:hypothetical protein
MRSTSGAVLAVLLLVGVGTAMAQVETGTVFRVDSRGRVVVLDDGRMYRVTPYTVLFLENQPAPLAALSPGQRVVIQAGEMVIRRDGQYIAVVPVPGSSGGAAAAPVTAVPIGVRQTILGSVADVDSDGDVKIKTPRDSFEIRVPPETLRHIRKGDNVILDVTITPPGAPAASPGTR